MPALRRSAGILACGFTELPSSVFPNGVFKQVRQPITEFVKLSVDGSEVTPILVSKKRPSGPLLNDHYHELQLRELKPGSHTATVVVRVIETGEQLSRTLSFSG